MLYIYGIRTKSILIILTRSSLYGIKLILDKSEPDKSELDKSKKSKKSKKINKSDRSKKSNKSNKSESKRLKPYFMEMQFHTDYRDTIAAFNDISQQKEIFNKSNQPVTHLDPSHKEASYLIKEFIRELNSDVKNSVSDYRTSNTGWDEPLPELKVKSGWDKQQEELGLPSSLYADPAKRAPIKLIKIDDIEKYTTEFETKYVCTIIIQKLNVEDQMIVKISFVQDNTDINGERIFFQDIELYTDNNKNSEYNVIIEEIFIVGFLTDDEAFVGDGDDFYNFKGIETDGMIDNKTIMKELIKKYKNRRKEDRKFSESLDEEGQIFHDELCDLSNYDAFKCTRSIYDDLSDKPITYE